MEDQKVENLISSYAINYNVGVVSGIEKGKETLAEGIRQFVG